MNDYTFNNVKLTIETIKKTDMHFADIYQGCIDEVLSGEVKVNDKEKYILSNSTLKNEYLKGEVNRYNLTYLQRAYWIQIGENIALLP